MFRTRESAGKLLAERLQTYQGQDVVVVALPRGGLPVGREVAHGLSAPLDILVARKIGAPGHEEFALGAVTARGTRVLNEEGLRRTLIPPGYLAAMTSEQQGVAVAREFRLRGSRHALPLAGKVVLLVDDGIATGMTMRAAIEDVRQAGARRIVVAAPVIAPDTYMELVELVDEVVALEAPPDFYAVGQVYEDFHQLDDEEARSHLMGVFHEELE